MLAISLCVLILMILSGVFVWLLTRGASAPIPIEPVVHNHYAAPPAPASPYVEMVQVRYLDAHGRVLGEQSLPKRARRPSLVYQYRRKRGVFLASHVEDGTWIYRFQSEDK